MTRLLSVSRQKLFRCAVPSRRTALAQGIETDQPAYRALRDAQSRRTALAQGIETRWRYLTCACSSPEGPPLRKGLRLTSSLRGIASASYQKVLITQKVASAISNAFIYAGTIHHAQMLCGVQSCSNENADTPQLNRD